MYSWELDYYLRNHNWELSKHEYLNITDIKSSPQISNIKYNPYDKSFYMETNDRYNWMFRIKEQKDEN